MALSLRLALDCMTDGSNLIELEEPSVQPVRGQPERALELHRILATEDVGGQCQRHRQIFY